MKKVFISIFMAALTLSAYAAETARVTIQLTSTNATYGNDELELKENTDRNASYESGYDAEKMMSQANKHSVLLYAFVGDQACSTVATDDLDGLAIGFTTNKYDTEYKLVFSNVSGRELKLYDRVLKTTTTIENSLEYSFTATEGRVAVNDRFVIGLPSYSVTMNAYGWASFSSADDLAIPAGLTAYKGAYAGEVLNLNEVDDIKANEGVILYGTAGQTYELNLGNGSSDFAGNNLKPASAWENHSGTVYVLHDEALYQYTGANFPANKAYLEIPVSAGAPRRISFRFNGTTALENAELNDAKAVKFIENGQVFIRRGNEVFNLQGQIVK